MNNLDEIDIFEEVDLGDESDSLESSVSLGDAPPEHLCDVVIAFQYLGLAKQNALECMQELARRRTDGDQFDFEKYISEEMNKLPKITENASLFNAILPLSKL